MISTLYLQLASMGEEILLFYNDHSSFNGLLEMMQSERERSEQSSDLLYHIELVHLLSSCTEGKNVYTEIKCHSLLPLDDIQRVVTHPDCVPEVWNIHNTAYSFIGRNIQISQLRLQLHWEKLSN